MADRQLCCLYAVAIRGSNYPERLAFSFLAEAVTTVGRSDEGAHVSTASRVGALNKVLRKPIRELMDKYDNPASIDKTAEVQGKVEHVRGIMQENIHKVIETHAALSDLEAKAESLNTNAGQFQQSSANVHKMFYWQKVKVTILLAIVGVAILAYIIIVIANLATK